MAEDDPIGSTFDSRPETLIPQARGRAGVSSGERDELLPLTRTGESLIVAAAAGAAAAAPSWWSASLGLGLFSMAGPSVTGTPTGGDVPLALVLVGFGLLMALAFTAGYFIIPRGGVEEVFLVHDSGLLLVHFSKTLRPSKDRDVLVGMLTAVQTFVNDAFSKESASDLREMDFGDRRLLLCKGSYGYLAVLVHGRTPWLMARRMRAAIAEVEAKYRQSIASWDGSSEMLAGADDLLIGNLLTGGLRQLRREAGAAVAWLRARVLRQAASPGPKPPRTRPSGIEVDPRETARALLRRPELQAFRPEYRDMMSASLQQIEEGRFSLTGLANIYLVMALQRTPKPNIVGWWNLVLRNVRDVLWSWPWTPASQAWVFHPSPEAAAAPPEAVPTPLEIPQDIPREVPPGTGMPAVGAAPRRAARADPLDTP